MAAPVALLRHRIKLNHTRKEGRKKRKTRQSASQPLLLLHCRVAGANSREVKRRRETMAMEKKDTQKTKGKAKP
jgi:hypothetical protein